MENQEMTYLLGTEALLTRVYKNGGTFQVFVDMIFPKQEYECYNLETFVVKSGTKFNPDRLKSIVIKVLDDLHEIKDVESFRINVFSRTEIKQNIERLKKCMHDFLLANTDETKEKFFEQLIILMKFNGFKIYGFLGRCYGLLNEDDDHLVAFCGSRNHVLFSLSEDDEKKTGCKLGCTFYSQKNSYDSGSYRVRKVDRINLALSQFYVIDRCLREFFSFDESEILKKITRYRQLDLLESK